MNTPTSSYREDAVFFPAGNESLFGIVAVPNLSQRGIMVLTVPGGSSPLTTHRNRLFTDLCRELAASGLHTMRFDYHGAGESTGIIEQFHLDGPFASDLLSATSYARSELSIDRFVFVGSCFGARTALAGAAAVEGVCAVVLVSIPVTSARLGEKSARQAASDWGTSMYLRKALRMQTLRGVFDPHHRKTYALHAKAKWHALTHRSNGDTGVSAMFLAPFRTAVEKGIPMLLLYGREDGYYQDFERARGGPLKDLLEQAGDSIDVIVVEGRVHGFTTVRAQQRAKEVVTEWLVHRVGAMDVAHATDIKGPSLER